MVGVRAPFILIQEAARLMRGGSVVNIITMASHGGEPVLTAYAASKGALATLTLNLGYSLQPARIRVNGLNICWTATAGMVARAERESGAMSDRAPRAQNSPNRSGGSAARLAEKNGSPVNSTPRPNT